MTHASYDEHSGATGLLATLLGVWVLSSCGRDVGVALPEDLGALPAQLRTLIEEHAEAVRADPHDARLHATLGLVYSSNSLWSEARSCYENAALLEPDEPLWVRHCALMAHYAGDAEGAARLLDREAGRFPDSAPLQHLLGETLLDRDRLAAAEAAFRLAVASAPAAPEPRAGLGECLLRKGDAEAATRELEEAVRLDPRYRSPHYLLGLAYRELGRVDEARAELDLGSNATKRRMSDPWSARSKQFAVGLAAEIEATNALMRTGRAQEAASRLERLLGASPDDLAVRVSLAKAYIATKRFDDAERTLREAEELDASRLQIHLAKAECYLQMKRHADALRAIDVAIALAPNQAHGHKVRGYVLYELERYPDAYRSLKASDRIDSENPEIHELIGECCVRLGRWEEALGHFEEFARLAPAAWQPHLKIGLTSGRLKLWDRARTALARAQAIAPDEPGVRRLAELISTRAQ